MSSWDILVIHTQRVRLNYQEEERLSAYDDLLKFLDVSEIAKGVVAVHDLHGTKGLEELLKTVESLPKACEEFTSSELLYSVLSLVRKHEVSLNIALQILSNTVQLGKASSHICPRLLLPVVNLVSSCVADEKLSTSELSCTLLEGILSRSKDGATDNERNSDEDIVDSIRSAMNAEAKGDGMLRLRYCSLFSRLLERGGDSMYSLCFNRGCISDMVLLAKENDPLLQMSAIGLLTSLAHSKLGVHNCFSDGVVMWLLQLAGSSDETADPYLGPDAMECLATIFNQASKVGAIQEIARSGDYEDTIITFATVILRSLSSESISGSGTGSQDAIWNAALHSLAMFTVSSKTVFMLMLSNDSIILALTSMLRSPKPLLRGSVLMCIAHILGANFNTTASAAADSSLAESIVFDTTSIAAAGAGADAGAKSFSRSTAVEDADEIKALKMKLLIGIGTARNTTAVSYILALAKQPVVETMQGACRLMCVLSRSTWGLNILFSGNVAATVPGSPMYEYIHNYHYLDDKTQKKWKFEVITSIANSPGFHHLPADLQALINKRVQQGPYFVAAQLAEPMVL